jgi:hypothetical protein
LRNEFPKQTASEFPVILISQVDFVYGWENKVENAINREDRYSVIVTHICKIFWDLDLEEHCYDLRVII